MSPPSRRVAFGAIVLVFANAVILGVAWVFHLTVYPGWKKGPLIDPASPYSPENAMVLFAVAACVTANVYAGTLAAWKTRRRWQPFVAMGASLLAAEGVIRAYLAYDMVTYFRPDPVQQWVVRPNLVEFDNLTGGGKLNTNADGLREVTLPRTKPGGPDSEYRVFVLGDSSNFGHGVEGDETWEHQLELLLAGKTSKPVHVINGACPGWTTVEGITWLRDVGLAYEPDLVIAGFNNDPGPEYLEDKARITPRAWSQAAQRVLFTSEVYLLAREVTLSLLRENTKQFTARAAGADPLYGKLPDEEMSGLTARVSLDDFVANLRTLDAMSPDFAWINMPINRTQQDLVARYVNPRYREAAAATAREVGFPIIDVDDWWARSREPNLYCDSHVFHPSPAGHLRFAQVVANSLADRWPGLDAALPVGGPPPSRTERTLRFGYSSLTPVHAHIGAVLRAMPELATDAGLDIELTDYASGKGQGDDVAAGKLDAFFSCELPAIRMLEGRDDLRIIATPGALGRIAVVALANGPTSLAQLDGKRVGLAEGSTPAMDWAAWSRGLRAKVVPLPTEGLKAALVAGDVDAVVSWDPWVADWEREGGMRVLVDRKFRSVLAVSSLWAIREPDRAAKLVGLLDRALAVAASDRARWDAEVASHSGWSLGTVAAVANQNDLLAAPHPAATQRWALQDIDRNELSRLLQYARDGMSLRDVIGPELLGGRMPPPRGEVPGGSKAKKSGAPIGGEKRGPPGGPKGPPPAGPKGPPPAGPKGPPATSKGPVRPEGPPNPSATPGPPQ